MKIVAFPEECIRVALLDSAGTDPSATPRVFLHGLGSSSIDVFPDIVSHQSMRSARSVLIDLPGFGHSTAPETWSCTIEDQADIVERMLVEQRLEQFDLIGHSMGGSIAIVLASRRPDMVNRLVVAEPNLDPGVGDLSVHIARQTEARFVDRGYRAILYQTRRNAARGDLLAASFLETVTRASPIALHRASSSLLADRNPTFREQLESLPMPRTTITGDRTLALDPPLSDPGIAQLLIESAGHVMMIDNPDGFAAAVSEALQP